MTTGTPRDAVRAHWFDRAVAAAFFAACETELVITWSQHTRPVLDAFLAAVLTVPLLWRRTAPLAVSVVVMAGTAVAARDPTGVLALPTGTLVAFLPAYAVGAYAMPVRRSLAGLAVCVAGTEAAVAIAQTGPYWAFLALGMTAASWTVGLMVASRRGLVAALARAQQVMRDERAQFERLALADERERIATELQAIVARCLSTMVVQTQAARLLLATDTAQAEAAIARIERTGQATLAELRRMLCLLRDEAAEARLTPQPGIGQLRSLVMQARGRGIDVECQVTGEPQPLTAVTDLILYRIVEELLAGAPLAADRAGRITLVVSFGEDDVRVEFSSGRPAQASAPSPAMRERIALANGHLEVAETDGLTRLRILLPAGPDGAAQPIVAPGHVEMAKGLPAR